MIIRYQRSTKFRSFVTIVRWIASYAAVVEFLNFISNRCCALPRARGLSRWLFPYFVVLRRFCRAQCVHTWHVFGMVCWLSLIYLRIERQAGGSWIFFSLVRASKTWANIVMAIQPGYRLLMSLDSTASSFASDLTADLQWSFALYTLCVTIRYIYIYSSYYSKVTFLEKVFYFFFFFVFA